MHQVPNFFNFVTKLYMFRASAVLQRPHNLHETYQLARVQLITPDDGHSRCPKHVEFRDKIKKTGYLMHLVGYLYEDYHDARSLERKLQYSVIYVCYQHYVNKCNASSMMSLAVLSNSLRTICGLSWHQNCHTLEVQDKFIVTFCTINKM